MAMTMVAGRRAGSCRLGSRGGGRRRERRGTAGARAARSASLITASVRTAAVQMAFATQRVHRTDCCEQTDGGRSVAGKHGAAHLFALPALLSGIARRFRPGCRWSLSATAAPIPHSSAWRPLSAAPDGNGGRGRRWPAGAAFSAASAWVEQPPPPWPGPQPL
jgi:hypothetical protein